MNVYYGLSFKGEHGEIITEMDIWGFTINFVRINEQPVESSEELCLTLFDHMTVHTDGELERVERLNITY